MSSIFQRSAVSFGSAVAVACALLMGFDGSARAAVSLTPTLQISQGSARLEGDEKETDSVGAVKVYPTKVTTDTVTLQADYDFAELKVQSLAVQYRVYHGGDDPEADWQVVPVVADEQGHMSVKVDGLQSATKYEAQLLVTIDEGAQCAGALSPFTTKWKLPQLAEVGVSEITNTTAKLIGQIDPQGEAGDTYQFQYWPDGDLGQVVSQPVDPVRLGDVSKQEIAQSLVGLEAHQQYKVRLVAYTPDGQQTMFPAVSEDPTAFQTLELPLEDPAVSVDEAKGETHKVQLTGTIDPQGRSDLEYYFRYWSDSVHPTDPVTCVTEGVVCMAPQHFNGEQKGSLEPVIVDGLNADALYNVQLVTRLGGKEFPASETVQFTTYPEPTLSEVLPYEVTVDAAKLSATYDVQGQVGYKLRFQYRKVGEGKWSQVVAVEGDDRTVTGQLSGLNPSTPYELVLVVTAPLGTEFQSPVATLTTQAELPLIMPGTAEVANITPTDATFKATIDTKKRTDVYVRVQYFAANAAFDGDPTCADEGRVQCTERFKLDTADGTLAEVPYEVRLDSLAEALEYRARLVLEAGDAPSGVAVVSFKTPLKPQPEPPPVDVPDEPVTPDPASNPIPSPVVDPTPIPVPDPVSPVHSGHAPRALLADKQTLVFGSQVALRVSCSGSSGQTCSGTVVLVAQSPKAGTRARGSVTKRGRGKVKSETKRKVEVLGKSSFQVPAGQVAKVQVHLNKLAVRQLKRGALKVTANVTIKGAFANSAAVSSATQITLRAAGKGRKAT